MSTEKTQHKKTIGVMVDWMYPAYHNQIITGIEDEARKQGVNLYFFIGNALHLQNREESSRNHIYEMMSSKEVDYLIILAGIFSNIDNKQSLIFLNSIASMPMLIVGHKIEGYSAVLLDNKNGLKELINHVIEEHGKKNLVFIKGLDNVYDADERFEAFKEVLATHNLPLREELIIPNNAFILEEGRKAMNILLDERQLKPGYDFDAVFACNDMMAIGAIDVIRERYTRLPEWLPVCGFDDYNLGWYIDTPLSTVRQPITALGTEAVRALLEHGKTDPFIKYIPTQAIIKKSCGCNRRMIKYTTFTKPDLPVEELKKDPALYRSQIIASIKPLVLLPANPEISEKLVFKIVDSFLLLIKQESGELFLEDLTTILDDVTAWDEDISLWNEALTVLRNYLLDMNLIKYLELKINNILDQAHTMISMKISKQQIYEKDEFEYFLSTMREVEESIKTSMEWDVLLKNILAGFITLGFNDIYLFSYQKQGVYTHNFKLLLSCTDRKQNSIDPQQTLFIDFETIAARLLKRDEFYAYCITPIIYKDWIFGFIIVNKNPHKYARLTYATITSQIGSTLKSHELLDQTRAAYEQLQITQKELQNEMEVARNIQYSLLPADLSHPDFAMAARMITAISVGGDYYDVIRAGNRDWFIIGDVSGHGVHAGLVMMMVQTTIHLLLHQDPNIAPYQLLTRVNAAIVENIRKLGKAKYMTITVIAYHEQGRFTFSGMHLPLMIFRKNTGIVEVIDTDGVWLGLEDNIEGMNKDADFALERGDCLLLYTDGVTESESKAKMNNLFGEKRLKCVLENTGSKTPQEIVEAVITDLSAYKQYDDITLFALKRL